MEQQQNADLTFEEALARLTEVVVELEKGELTLDQSLSYFEQGIGLLRILVQKLNAFEERVDVLMEDFYQEAPSWLDSRDSGGKTK
ncbi:MAG: exodeoxyribonuclease VII small subunit [Thermacetogeniaceae bacterium]|jgi:exodeoxyribonuclease VII small subunit|nr:exodeoxyribonuclease VII small subunit [Thermoanaerobacterales bacterium]NLN20873.1 exodeoxyribonuclease VII small subunit [Syntrophomonadaceae bacterium]